MKKPTIHRDPPTHFWFIYNPNSLTAPTKQFSNPKVAQMVADELAKKHPGETFYVLKTEYISSVEYIPNVGWSKAEYNAPG